MRKSVFTFSVALALIACSDERNIKYHIAGSGFKGLQIEYRTVDGLVTESSPELPWTRWVTLETGEKAYFLATCSTDLDLNLFGDDDDEDQDPTECWMGKGSISNPDGVLKESFGPMWGSEPKIELEYEIDY